MDGTSVAMRGVYMKMLEVDVLGVLAGWTSVGLRVVQRVFLNLRLVLAPDRAPDSPSTFP